MAKFLCHTGIDPLCKQNTHVLSSCRVETINRLEPTLAVPAAAATCQLLQQFPCLHLLSHRRMNELAHFDA